MLVAYLVVSVIWGSTYLAIRIGVQELPPALFAGLRFVVAGSVLLLVARLLGHRLPARGRDWRTNAVVGLLLLFCGNGLVVWAEQYTPSGIAAIFVVTVTLWLALFDAVIPGSPARPTLRQVAGLLVGFGGTMLLVGEDLGALRDADWRGPVALTTGAALWALGSVYSTRRPTQSGPYVNSALQMLAGGIALVIVGTAAGEWSAMHLSPRGIGALAYLIVFGSLVAYSSYVYLLRHLPPTVLGTHSYVNTVVAVFLGWLVLAEPLTTRTLVAMAIVLGAVVWVRGRREKREDVRT